MSQTLATKTKILINEEARPKHSVKIDTVAVIYSVFEDGIEKPHLVKYLDLNEPIVLDETVQKRLLIKTLNLSNFV